MRIYKSEKSSSRQNLLKELSFPWTQLWVEVTRYKSRTLPSSSPSFLKFLADTCPFWGHWYPCFGFLVTLPEGFKARVGSALFHFCRGKCNVHSPRSTSGATCANLLAAGMQLVTSPHACAEVGLSSDLKGQSPGQKTNALSLCQRTGWQTSILKL